ncbi:hypothetical protein [Sinorhizobium meliloti]|uniref:hypothetical protein n=1 Tax=Rhizobium meliloti TaxID=382 RepID=UPI0018F340F4|nr:hypothetical protein [Sinorhizobium meliloti]
MDHGTPQCVKERIAPSVDSAGNRISSSNYISNGKNTNTTTDDRRHGDSFEPIKYVEAPAGRIGKR